MEARQIVVLDPVSIPKIQRITKNRRPIDIAGMRVAVVDNTKPNFSIFMDRVEEILIEKYKVAKVARYRKPGRTVGVTQEMLAEIKATCDFAITGLGD